jgi:hypothetical protein
MIMAAIWYGLGRGVVTVNNNADERPIADPLDVVFDFYNEWHNEARTKGQVSAGAAVMSSPILSTSTRENLNQKLTAGTEGIDPVLCQAVVPEKIKIKVIHQIPAEMEVMVMSRYASATPIGFALVKLSLNNREWHIDDITCSRGDVLEAREFSFEQTGQLLKNVPAPLDSNFWHLVFTEDNTPGHTAELHFSSSSVCTLNGRETLCDTATFAEAANASVEGNMTESGVDVLRMTITPQE